MLVVASPAEAVVVPRSAGMESGTLTEFDQVSQLGGTVTTDSSKAFAGTWSARAQYAGGGSNAYERGIWGVSLKDGDDVWYSAAYFLPVGFKAAMQGEVDLLRWDNWVSHPDDTDWGGLVIFGSDKRMRLMRFAKGASASTTLVGPFDVPEGRWVRLEVHQVLGAQTALSEVFMDGALVGRSTQPNTYGRPIERLRAGIVAISAGKQTNPLTLWFDSVALSGQSAGGSTPPPAP
ncbi:MAG TPA: hypothetical protein PKD63_01425, partial [Solirubrobacteraceae bacterium]|nr:hypothetical protein [Solirubrobacteraceae bacterium]